MKLKFVPLAFVLAVVATLSLPMNVRAQDDHAAAAAEASPAKAGKKGGLPYQGKVASVDAAAKTITMGGKKKERVITVNDETKITKDGAAATLDAVTAGEMIHGTLTKTDDGKEVAKSVMIGAPAPKAPKAAKAPKVE